MVTSDEGVLIIYNRVKPGEEQLWLFIWPQLACFLLKSRWRSRSMSASVIVLSDTSYHLCSETAIETILCCDCTSQSCEDSRKGDKPDGSRE